MVQNSPSSHTAKGHPMNRHVCVVIDRSPSGLILPRNLVRRGHKYSGKCGHPLATADLTQSTFTCCRRTTSVPFPSANTPFPLGPREQANHQPARNDPPTTQLSTMFSGRFSGCEANQRPVVARRSAGLWRGGAHYSWPADGYVTTHGTVIGHGVKAPVGVPHVWRERLGVQQIRHVPVEEQVVRLTGMARVIQRAGIDSISVRPV